MRFKKIILSKKIERLFFIRSITLIYRQAYEIEREKLRERGKRRPKAHRIVLRMIRLFRERAFPASFRKARVAPSTQLPEWLVQEFRIFAEKELTLFPSPEFLHQFTTWIAPEEPMPGTAYARAITSLKRPNYEAIVLAPWLKQGGADKGLIQFCKAYSEQANVLLITTLDEPSPWLPLIPPMIEVLELGPLLRDLSQPDAQLVLGRLLLQLSPKLIHIVQSQLGWETILAHTLSLHALNCKLLGSFFMDEVAPDQRPYGYTVTSLPRAVSLLDAVLTDSEQYRARLASRFPGHDHLFKTIHFAQALDSVASPTTSEKSDCRILWAGRLSAQKRIDLLHAIASRRPDLSFDVFGAADKGTLAASWAAKLAALPNVSMRGAYQGFENIPEKERYACFLYTTAYDGLPNVLLEAASVRIPIIAPPSIGGLADLVQPETAWCVEASDDPASYIAALDACLNDDPKERCENAFALVRERHSWSRFRNTIYQTLDEIGVKLGEPPTSSPSASAI